MRRLLTVTAMAMLDLPRRVEGCCAAGGDFEASEVCERGGSTD